MARLYGRAFVMGFLVLGAAPAVCTAQNPLIKPSDRSDIRRDVGTGTFGARQMRLTPCEPDRAIAFSEERHTSGMWAGQFRVVKPGTGDWTLVVESLDGSQEWHAAISTAHKPNEPSWQSAVIFADAVRVSLKGPGVSSSACPLVRLEAELEETTKSKPRGQVGSDDRWDETRPELLALPDSAAIRGWAGAVVHLEVLAPTGVTVPCTGFFISPHALLTAYHCVNSPEDAEKAGAYLGGRIVHGKDLRLLISQPDLDFSLLWLEGAQQPVTLPLGDPGANDLIVWQQPDSNRKLVSVLGCVVDKIDGANIRHKCDTVGGSSGSPVQARATGVVVALHTSGCTASNATAACVNAGVRARDIRDRILSFEMPFRMVESVAAEEVLSALQAPR
jgi:hypothetical protein